MEPDKNTQPVSFPPDIDRDIAAIVVAILQGQPVSDFVMLIRSVDRLPLLLLRACSDLAMSCIYLLENTGQTREQAVKAVLETYQQALLQYAQGADTPPPKDGDDNSG